MHDPKQRWAPLLIPLTALFLAVIIFLIDSQVPVGIMAAIPYTAVVLLSLFALQRWFPLAMTVLVTLLSTLGFLLSPEGNPRPIAAANRAITIVSLWVTCGLGCLLRQQIDERDQIAEQLRHEKNFIERLLNTARSIILVLDPEGRVVHFNPFMEQLSGHRLSEVRGEDWFEIFAAEPDRSRLREAFQKSINGAEMAGVSCALVTRSGGVRRISWWSKPLKDEEGAIHGILAVGYDATDLLHAQEQALQAERLAAIGQTIAAISHESRNELLALKICIDRLGEILPDATAEVRMIIERTRGCRTRLERVLSDLRAFAAPISLDLTPSSLSSIWQQAWEQLEEVRVRRNAALHERPGHANPLVNADPFRLQQVFRNLFENALAACSDPVVIEVACSEAELGGQPAIRVEVRDNGPGLNPVQQAKIFEPFFTTKSEGTGLGMAIARRIVEAHGGTISAGNSETGGAEFIIFLPQPGND